MKPVRLRMTAFGPYGNTEDVAFDDLCGHKLFLICGPTGAGKTSLLDAMTFALYGEASSLNRDPSHIRSHHAERLTPTRVELDFDIGDTRYRVVRQPAWDRPKKRGPGTTTEPTQAELHERSGGHFRTIASRPNDVLARVTEIMGMSAKEFREIILLPQGEFRRFLEAKPDERESILETLFHTSFYARIARSLKTSANKQEKMLQALSDKLAGVHQGAGVETTEDLQKAIHTGNITAETLQTEVAACEQKAEFARTALETAKHDAAQIAERDRAVESADLLEATALHMQARQVTLLRARDALAIADLVSHHDVRFDAVSRAALDLDATAAELDTARKQKEQAEAVRLQQEALGKTRQDLDARVWEAEKLFNPRDQLVELEVLRQKKHRELEAATDAHIGLQRKHTAIERKSLELGEALARERKLGETADQLSHEVERANATLEQLRELDTEKRAHAELEREWQQANEAVGTGARLQANASHRVAELERAWVAGQAALLASNLEAGEPCPVCGSTLHPRPADEVANMEAPNEAELDASRARVRELETLQMQRHTVEARLHAERKAKQTRIETLRLGLESMADRDIAELTANLAELQSQHDSAARARKRALQLENNLTQINTDRTTLRVAIDNAAAAASNAQASAAVIDARITEMEKLVPPELRSPGELEKLLKSTRDAAAAMRKDLLESRERAEATAQRAAAALAALEHTQKHVEREAELEDAARCDLERALRSRDFADRAAWARACLTQEQAEEVNEELQKYNEAVAAARDRLARAQAAARGLRPPDIKALQAWAQESATTLETIRKRYLAALARLDQLQNALRLTHELGEQQQQAEGRWRELCHLADVLSGKNQRKLSFQRFVLAGLFDDVLAAASHRLKIMSRSRYHLRQDDTFKRGGQQGGLNLVVDDAYTGSSRPVSTLSGGESFLAALALALGLSDVVQNYSGGIHLDALFIDEGFGSLDPEALDLAIRALTDLQTGGRMVGIISHVPELQERIPARIEITPTPSGSTVQVVIG
ncbi:MAG: hypothetical protein A2341_19380 [Deltaproteobacteria bacterium RIFOXYB12_FULL_58_9]|nr:MAG: hypothetical protein A2341_19380 [Deltaproteobacteria bacterium RIFOXYB12_FULL_58_9]